MSKPVNNLNLKTLYFISFVEGGVVMVTEIAGAKLLTPYFGASLYSWASTLSITLLALMAGYYFGGFTTTKVKYSTVDKIIWVFLLSGLLVLMMPTLGHLIMQRTISFSFFYGLLVSELSFLFFPIFLMGMISPMIIYQATKKAEQSGRSAGNIYAISTCGGIIFTLVFGFYIIPNYGISLPVRVLGLIVSAIGLFLLIRQKMTRKSIPLTGILIFLSSISFNQNKFHGVQPRSNMTLIDYSEGLLGELKVIDYLAKNPDGSPVSLRKLKINNVQQNFVFVNDPKQSLLYYVGFTKQLIKTLPKKESALIIGLGAGSIFNILNDQKIYTETVEIDKRIYDVGVKYFSMPQHKEHVITDGRYFINVTKKKYDLIILDAIVGESVPAQLLSLECFEKIDKLLNTNGTLIIEYGGVNSFADNSFAPSLYKTLLKAGFQVQMFNPLKSTHHGDLLFVASKNKLDIAHMTVTGDILLQGGRFSDYEMSLSAFDETSSTILTDDKNNSDFLLRSHYFKVRKGIRDELAKMVATDSRR